MLIRIHISVIMICQLLRGLTLFSGICIFYVYPLLLLDVPAIPIVCINVDIPPNALAVNINAALTEALISLEAIRYMPLVISNREHIIILI